MKRTVMVATTVLALALSTGCGSPEPADQPSAPSTLDPPTSPGAADPTRPPTGAATATGPVDLPWQGRIDVDFDTGEFTAPGFNEQVDREAPDWAQHPESAVAMLLHLDQVDGTVDTDLSDDDDPVVVVTVSELADDSVAAQRYRVVLTEGDDGRYRFSSGQRTHRCQPDRGPQEFSTDPCV